MVTQKVKFTLKSIDNQWPLEVNIEKVEVLSKEGNKEVEKILICPLSKRGDIKNVLESKKSDGSENKIFEIEYDDEDLEIEKDEDKLTCNFTCSNHGPKSHEINDKKELRIWETSLIKLNIYNEYESK